MSQESICLEEVKEYYSIKAKYDKNWKKDSKEILIIDKSWYTNWKNYINKTYFKKKYNLNPNKTPRNSNTQTTEKFTEFKRPQQINNQKLLIDIKDFYNDKDVNNKDNKILREEIKKSNIKYIPKEIWDFFIKKYQGGPEIIAQVHKGPSNPKNEFLIEVIKLRLDLLFLPDKKSIIGKNDLIENTFNSKNLLKLYISKYQKCSEIKEKIIQIENKIHNFSKKEINNNSIKLWLIRAKKFNLKDLCSLIVKTFGEDALGSEDDEKNKRYKLLEETPVNPYKKHRKYDYEIILLDNCEDKVINEMNIESADIILIENINKKYYPYFETKKDEALKGKCKGCKKESLLITECPCGEIAYCNENCLYKCFEKHFKECKVQCIEEDDLSNYIIHKRGLCGLVNFKNNCFMNASIQCLGNCWELTNYFIRNKYKKHINLTNPIGSHGLICRAYANILNNLWNGNSPFYKAKNFVYIFNQFYHFFTGNQQDAQEFLTLLIDGLHEDLNRVIDKPYNAISPSSPTTSNSDDKLEEIKNQQNWYNFKRRNQSILIELFYGQFRTRLQCDNCKYKSIAYDPFCCVSLPLPPEKEKAYQITCYFIFYNLKNKPLKIKLNFISDCTILALRNKISSILRIHPFSFLIQKMNKEQKLGYFVHWSQLISSVCAFDNKTDDYIFLLQFDPKLFYDTKCNSYIIGENLSKYKKCDYDYVIQSLKNKVNLFDIDCEEDDKDGHEFNGNDSYYQQYSTSANKIQIENNFGMNSDYLLVLIEIVNYNKESSNVQNKKYFFPRAFFLDKKSSCQKIHLQLYEYFKNYLDIENVPFDKAFPNIEDKIKAIENLDQFKSSNYPYWLTVKCRKNKQNKCCVCDREKCSDCLFPYNNSTLQDLINKYPKNNKNKEIDNTYFYNTYNNKSNNNNKQNNYDFTLKIITKLTCKKMIEKFNECEKYEFGNNKEIIERKRISLEGCFKQFIKVEKLDGPNKYFCEKCKSEHKAQKQVEICHCPHFLIIQLKRFKHHEKGVSKDKSELKVIFPIRGLNMADYVKGNYEGFQMIYDLYAVCYHWGGTSNYGHYYAICKNVNHKWYRFDDCNVRDEKEEEIVNKSAYVLFYRRKNLENILDLETLYQSKFINYEPFIEGLPNDINCIENIYEKK